MKRAALYVRVSTEDQKVNGLSVDNQIEALRQYCKDNELTEVGLYNDAGISARKRYSKRPALLSLMQDCKDKKVDIILFTKLDRWFRSVGDYYEVQRVLDEAGVPWRAIWEDYETETSAGVFKVNIMLSVAQSEADRTSERIRSVFEYKRQKGEYVGGNKAPLGYSRDGKHFIYNEEEKEGVIQFFSTYEKTLCIADAVRKGKEYGLPIDYHKARRMLDRSCYWGEENGHECPAYITKEQHSLFLKIKEKNTRKSTKTGYKYIFSGMLTCSCCGNKMISGRSRNKKKEGYYEYIYYSCHNHESNRGCDIGASISEKVLENYLLENIDPLIGEYNASIVTDIKKQSDNKKEIDKMRMKLSRIGDRYEEGEISKETYIEKKNSLQSKISALEKEPLRMPQKLPSDWLDIYDTLDEDHKHSFWFHIIDHITVDGLSCRTPLVYFR